VRDGVVHGGVERVADLAGALEPLLPERVEQERARLDERLRLRGDHRVVDRVGEQVRLGEVERVEHREQQADEGGRAARRELLELAIDPLAVVLEVGLEAPERVEVLVALTLDVGAGVLLDLGLDRLDRTGACGAPRVLLLLLGSVGRRRVDAGLERLAHGSSTISASTISSSLPVPADDPSSPEEGCDWACSLDAAS